MTQLSDNNRLPVGQENVIQRRHHEWSYHNLRWRWLLDSFEGGESYRMATYGTDTSRLPIMNLIRHKREYPDPRERNLAGVNQWYVRPEGTDMATAATDDDYTLRLARTPIPTLFPDAIEAHLSGIYSEEVDRDTDMPEIEVWWTSVDGKGTTIDQWMAETVAPLLMALGCLDIVVDYPPAPEDAPILSRADEQRHGLDAVVASYILPENMVWWKLGPKDEYLECLICELQDDGSFRWRHWTETDWTLYDHEGEPIDGNTHPYGRPPIVRLFDRKRPRYRNVGKPRYEAHAEIQREFYNRDSELILSDTTQAHPLLQGPEDYVQEDGSIPIGPNWLLPKKKNVQGASVSYEGFDVVNFPKEGAASIRENLMALVDRSDRAAMLTKPAGAQQGSGQTVSQSGVSKRLDSVAGNNLLSKIAVVLQKAEQQMCCLVCRVLGMPETTEMPENTTVTYPRSFDLMSAEELAKGITDFQAVLSGAGSLPETEGELLKKLVRLMLPGMDDDEYDEMDAEIDTFLEGQADRLTQMREGMASLAMTPEGTTTDGGTEPGPESEPATAEPAAAATAGAEPAAVAAGR